MTEIPDITIETYEEPEAKSALELERWELFRYVENPRWGLKICVHHDDSTGLPYVTGFGPLSSSECLFSDHPVEVVGRILFEEPG